MNGDRTLRLPLNEFSTGSSFGAELRELIWRRARIVAWIGLSVSAVVFVVNQLVVGEHALTGLEIWRVPLRFGHMGSFALALAVLQLGRNQISPQAVIVPVLAFNVLLSVLAPALFHPTADYLFALSIILFVHAAFIPCVQSQWLLGGLAVATLPVAMLVTRGLLPEVAAFWRTVPDGLGFWQHLAWQSTGAGILAAVALVTSRTLYSLRKTAHQAERLGNYLIERELGEGGMGKVFRARHALICRPTAVKVLAGDGTDGQAAIGRFEREVRLSASLTHPNTITIFDFGRTADETFYYAMEYLEGLDLQQLVERFGPLPASRAVYLLLQACGSLGEAHARGIVHRDIKPSNLFLTRRGGLYDFVKVLDFGLARELRPAGGSDLTKTGMVFGTPRYIAPEAVYGGGSVDARADIYNLGAVAYWMLTGRHLFAGSSSLDLLIDHVKTEPERVSVVSELELPEALDEAVMRCLRKRPEERFQQIEEFEAALRAVPLDPPWDGDQAREWWTLHAPEELSAVECAPGEDVSANGIRGPSG